LERPSRPESALNDADHAAPLDLPSAQAAFVAAMRTAAPYAALHPVPSQVTCIETHISWVFLTGPYAYKVKKPLRLSFIDYSTAARRAEMCREELRLNRRFAADLYVDVVPISGTPEHPQLAGGGEPFEHALRMVQFDPQLELGHLLQSGTVAAAEIAALGTALARMQAEAERAAEQTLYGAPDTAHRVTTDNFTEIARALPGAVEARQLAALRTRLGQVFAASRERMERRRLDGHVRECHGDLHCGNVVRWRGALVPFDGLEFDPALRFIDVANDVAFLTMDLAEHGRRDLRRALLQSWVSASGDFDGIALLHYYETYRALVRAKVAALRGLQARGWDLEASTRAHEYLAWAVDNVERPAPAIVLMAGLSGSGKTWLAQRIAGAVDALHLRSDVERKRLAGLGPLETSSSPPDAGIYTREFNDRTYQRLRECAGACLQGGESVIVDAANLRREERERFLALALSLAARALIVHCDAPADVLKQRVAARQAGRRDASEATVDLLDRQPAYWEPFTDAERQYLVTVDTTQAQTEARAAEEIRARLGDNRA